MADGNAALTLTEAGSAVPRDNLPDEESSKSAEGLERSQSGNQEGATGDRAGLGGAGLVVPENAGPAGA